VGIGGANNRVVRNRIHSITADGMHFAPGPNMLIEGNSVRNLYAPHAVHLDGLQLTTSGLTAPSAGITIRRNHLIRGDGTPFQGIFGGNEAKLPFRDLLIEENLVAGGSYHGISIQQAESPIIRRNYVTGDAGSVDGTAVMVPWIKLVTCTDVTLIDNFCTSGPIFVQTTTKEVKNNKTIKLPRADDFSAAEAWWTKMGYGKRRAQASLADTNMYKLSAIVAIAGASLNTESTRRTALAQMIAQLGAL
jgi:hypothetical protein